MRVRRCDHRSSIAVRLVVTIAIAMCAFMGQRRYSLSVAEIKAVRAEAARERQAARLAAANEGAARGLLKRAESRRLAALSEAERYKRRDRALILAVEALRLESTIEARSSLLGALLARPAVGSFLHRAEGRVTSVSFSPDGRTLAVGCIDPPRGGVVIFWDASRPTEEPMVVPEGGVREVAFSTDGKWLAAAAGRSVVIWDVARRARLGDEALEVPNGLVASLAFSADSGRLAVGCSNGEVVLFDVPRYTRLTPEPLLVNEHEVNEHQKEFDVESVSFDGASLITLFSDRLERWNPKDRKRISALSRPETEAVECAALSQDGRTLAASVETSEDVVGGVLLWDMTTHRRTREQPLAVSAGRIACLALNADGTTLAAGCRGSVVLWDLVRKAPLAGEPLVIAEADVVSLALSPDGARLAAGYRGVGGGGGVVMWDLEVHSQLADRLPSLGGGVADVAFSPDGSTIAASYDRGGGSVNGVALWDAKRRTPLTGALLEVRESLLTSLAFSPDGATIGAGCFGLSGGGEVALWDVQRRVRIGDEPMKVAGGGNVLDLAFSPDGATVAGTYIRRPGTVGVALWDAKRGIQLADHPLEATSLHLAFSPDGKTLAVGYEVREDGGLPSGGVAFWDARGLTPRSEGRRAVAKGGVTSVTFSPDGSTIAAAYTSPAFLGDGSSVVALWDAHTGARLANHFQDVAGSREGGLAVSPDGGVLAALYHGPDGDGVMLWDMRLRRRISTTPLEIAEGEATRLAFSPDGKTLAVGYRDALPAGRGGVLLFDLDVESWMDRAARIANRNLTKEEWRRFLSDTPYHATFTHLPASPTVDPAPRG